MFNPHSLIVLIAALLGLTTSVRAVVTAIDDQVILCDGPAVVDALANDSNDTGQAFEISLDQNNCPGAIPQVDTGVFDVTFALGATSFCTFQYSANDGLSADSAIVMLERQAGCEGAVDAPTLLSVHPDNPRYLVNAAGETVLLSGGHVWQNMQDYGPPQPPNQTPPTNCGDHECGAEEWDYLANTLGHNFTRGWHWEQGKQYGYAPNWVTSPVPYQYDGQRYDLNSFNQAYFDRLRDRVQAASNAGLYISVMLFEGFSPRKPNNNVANGWADHPFNPLKTNSLGGYNPDATTNGGDNDGGGEEIHSLKNATITAFQYAYIDKLIEELNDFDNLIWEICNECGDSDGNPTLTETMDWMNAMADYLRAEEMENDRKQHLIWISAPFGNGNLQNPPIAASHADIVSYRGHDQNNCDPGDVNPCFHNDPPLNKDVLGDDQARMVLLDSDHIYNPYCVPYANRAAWCGSEWPWKTFMRGYNPVFMDTTRTLTPFDGTHSQHPHGVPQEPTGGSVDRTRMALGQVQQLANELVADLGSMTPSTTIASTGYALANQEDGEYLVYQPDNGDFNIDVIAGLYDITWFEVEANDGMGLLHGTLIGEELDGGTETFGQTGPGWVVHLIRTGTASDLAVTDPDDVTAEVGTDVSFSITASQGVPPYEYQWQGSPAGPFSFVDLVPSGAFSGINSPTLIVDPVTLGHDGWYRCEVTDSTGHTVYSGAAELTVTELALTANPDEFTFTELASYYVIDPDDMIANDDPNIGVWIDFVNGLRDPLPSGNFNIIGGNIRYVPETGFPGGVVTFEYQTTDGVDDSNWATVTLNIPSLPGTFVANPDTISYPTYRSSYNIRDNADLLANDDPNVGVVIDFHTGVIHPSASQGTLTRDPGGTVPTMVFTPVAGFPGGNVNFNYKMTNGTNESNFTTVTLQIPPPPAPIANDDNVVTSYETPVEISFDELLGNDEGTGIEVFDFPAPNPGNGTLSIGANSVTYTPNNGYSGLDAFQYRIRDVAGQLSGTATVRLFIGPVAVDDVAYECGGGVMITHQHLLSNDLGDDLTFWNIVTPVNNGSLDHSVPGQIRWTPSSATAFEKGQVGLKTDVLAQFSYAAIDASNQRTNPAWVRIKHLCHGDGDADKKQRYLLLQHILRD
ncbi:MAG: hypothetical protein DHS20C11_11710 [Lysobacteraceae bacterium]|nr:MAG: hypothetical protein DHS20C11_11710 [Xanthomonadaceae bacterium]